MCNNSTWASTSLRAAHMQLVNLDNGLREVLRNEMKNQQLCGSAPNNLMKCVCVLADFRCFNPFGFIANSTQSYLNASQADTQYSRLQRQIQNAFFSSVLLLVESHANTKRWSNQKPFVSIWNSNKVRQNMYLRISSSFSATVHCWELANAPFSHICMFERSDQRRKKEQRHNNSNKWSSRSSRIRKILENTLNSNQIVFYF